MSIKFSYHQLKPSKLTPEQKQVHVEVERVLKEYKGKKLYLVEQYGSKVFGSTILVGIINNIKDK